MIGFGLVLLVLGEVEVVLSPRGLGTTALYDAEVCVCVWQFLILVEPFKFYTTVFCIQSLPYECERGIIYF